MAGEGTVIAGAGESAGRAELDATAWPPEKSDAERVGGAVGAAVAGAACTAYGAGVAAPLCAAIGDAIARALVSAVWDVASGLLDNTGSMGLVEGRSAGRVLVFARKLGRNLTFEQARMHVIYGCVRQPALDYWNTRLFEQFKRPLTPDEGQTLSMLQELIYGCEKRALARLAGEYARAHMPKKKSSGAPLVLGAAALGFGAWLWLS